MVVVDDRDDDDETMMMMMTHGQQWAACARLFSACWDDALPILPPFLRPHHTPFHQCIFPFQQQAGRQARRQMEKAAVAAWRHGDSSSSSKYLVQRHSRAQRQTNTYTQKQHTDLAFFRTQSCPLPFPLPFLPFPPPFPFLLSLSLYPHSPPTHSAYPHDRNSIPAPIRPLYWYRSISPGAHCLSCPGAVQRNDLLVATPATLEGSCALFVRFLRFPSLAFNWRTLYTTVADTHHPGLYHSA